MRTIMLFALLLSFCRFAQAQTMDASDQNGNGIGVPHYIHPDEPRYRLIFGMGANVGKISDEPLATVISAQYQIGPISLGGQFISNSSTGGAFPRKNFSEMGALAGFINDYDIAGYASKPRYVHTSIALGAGVVTYSERWRRFRRGQPIDTTTALQANVFQTALSLPLQVQAIYEPWKYVGIGATLWLDVNSIAPSYGASIVLEARY